MSFKVVIPARYGAQRLPGKPLLDIQGKPMLQHTWEQASQSRADEVIIATDDSRIQEAALAFGANCVMTAEQHSSGTDRIQEVAALNSWEASTIVVNVQGDEPLIPPAAINLVATNLESHSDAGIATLCESISKPGEENDPNAVKVIFDKDGYALYFSRAAIPYGAPSVSRYRHVGIYAYRVKTLNAFVEWAPAEMELSEKLEQLRALAHGVRIHVDQYGESMPAGVDTLEDLESVRQHLAKQ